MAFKSYKAQEREIEKFIDERLEDTIQELGIVNRVPLRDVTHRTYAIGVEDENDTFGQWWGER